MGFETRLIPVIGIRLGEPRQDLVLMVVCEPCIPLVEYKASKRGDRLLSMTCRRLFCLVLLVRLQVSGSGGSVLVSVLAICRIGL